MNVNRIIEVYDGDTINALQEFLAAWWKQYKFDAMLAPIELSDQSGVELQVIKKPQGLMSVNPFAPVMISNAAIKAIQFIQDFPKAKLAVMLRPCELRTFVELQKIDRVHADSDSLVLLGVDCPGVLHPDEFRRQAEALGIESVTRSVLHDATEGQLRSPLMRTACQICDWGSPRGADLTIGVIGADSEKFILLIAHDETTDARLVLETEAARLATEYQVSHRETVVGAIADMRANMRNKLLENFQSKRRFNELGCLLACFANCTMCGECLNACPLYNGGDAEPQDKVSLIEELAYISRWLASCTGCGMCEQSCNQNVPLTLLVSSLSHRICQELHYIPGDPAQQFPWVVKLEDI
jgi:formate dehydrogenase subunit beta